MNDVIDISYRHRDKPEICELCGDKPVEFAVVDVERNFKSTHVCRECSETICCDDGPNAA